MRLATPLALLAALLVPVAGQAQTVVGGSVVAQVGQPLPLPGGGTATAVSVNVPVVNGEGEVGFSGNLTTGAGNVGYVFFHDAVRWTNADAPPDTVLSGVETWMGVGNDGQFIYSPSVNGNDGVWTDRGYLTSDGQPAPNFPGQFISYASRPTMRPDGTPYWFSGLSNTPGGATVFDAIMTSADASPGGIITVIAEGETVDGVAISNLDFDYVVSDNGAHLIHVVTRATGSTATDGAVVLNRAVVAQEGSPVATGSTELWQNFDLVRVNNAGDYFFTGDTNGPTTADEFIAYNGAIVLREGDTVDGVTLGSEVRGLGFNNTGRVVWAWTTSAGTADEALFLSQASDMAGTAQLLLRTGDGIDTNNDGTADYTVVDFEFANGDGHAALDLGSAPVVFARFDLQPLTGGGSGNAIVAVDLTPFIPTAGAPGPAPAGVALAASPNPFHDAASLALTLDAPQAVTVEVLDALGRRVALVHDGPLAAGRAALALDGARLAPGVYLVRATGADWSLTQRVTRF